MFLSKLWSVAERIPPFLLFSTLIHQIVQTLVTIECIGNYRLYYKTHLVVSGVAFVSILSQFSHFL